MFNMFRKKRPAVARGFEPHLDIKTVDAGKCRPSVKGTAVSSIDWETAIHAGNHAVLLEGKTEYDDVVAMDVIDRRHIAAIAVAIRNEVERQYQMKKDMTPTVVVGFDKPIQS